MTKIRRLFFSDIRRFTGNIVPIIIMIGLIVLPGFFTWFNVAASWDPFSNTKNLKFAVANTDEGYKSDLIVLRTNIGDQVVSSLRANPQLDWTFTSKEDAVEGTKSGKYYAAVVIPEDFSKTMLTFFSENAKHVRLSYYTNEKKNALAPKVTGQGADQISAQVNKMFVETITDTALSVAGEIVKGLDGPDAQRLLTNFGSNMSGVASNLEDTAHTLQTFVSLVDTSKELLTSSGALSKSAIDAADGAHQQMAQTQAGIGDVTAALNSSGNILASAFASGYESYDTVAKSIDTVFGDVGTNATDVSSGLRLQAGILDQRMAHYQKIRDDLHSLSKDDPIINSLVASLDSVISWHKRLRDSLNESATKIEQRVSSAQAEYGQVKELTRQAKESLDTLKTNVDTNLKPQLDQIGTGINEIVGTLNQGVDAFRTTADDLQSHTDGVLTELTDTQDVLKSNADLLTQVAGKIRILNTDLTEALKTGDSSTVKAVLAQDPDTLATTLVAPIRLDRNAIYPVGSFGTALTPFYTFIPLWVGALLTGVTLKTSVPRRVREELGNPSSTQLFLGHFGIFGVLAFLQASFSCLGSLLFLGVHAKHPLLFLISGWLSSLTFAFIVYTFVTCFANVGKALSVILLVVQISATKGAYPLQLLPGFISGLSPWLPITHSVQAMRAALAGVYMNDFWTSIGKLLLFVVPMLVLGVVFKKYLGKFNQWYIAKVETTKLL